MVVHEKFYARKRPDERGRTAAAMSAVEQRVQLVKSGAVLRPKPREAILTVARASTARPGSRLASVAASIGAHGAASLLGGSGLLSGYGLRPLLRARQS